MGSSDGVTSQLNSQGCEPAESRPGQQVPKSSTRPGSLCWKNSQEVVTEVQGCVGGGLS